jgi:hypothetical protein
MFNILIPFCNAAPYLLATDGSLSVIHESFAPALKLVRWPVAPHLCCTLLHIFFGPFPQCFLLFIGYRRVSIGHP